MTAQVDIRTGDKILVDFLLKPLHKTLSESLLPSRILANNRGMTRTLFLLCFA